VGNASTEKVKDEKNRQNGKSGEDWPSLILEAEGVARMELSQHLIEDPTQPLLAFSMSTSTRLLSSKINLSRSSILRQTAQSILSLSPNTAHISTFCLSNATALRSRLSQAR
jgi:hypothetical protein